MLIMPLWLWFLIAICVSMLIGAWFQRRYDIAERKLDAVIAATHDPRCISRDPASPYRHLCDCDTLAIADGVRCIRCGSAEGLHICTEGSRA